MDCPKCSGELERKTYGRKIVVFRCNGCFGLFCKPDVLIEMKKEWMSEVLDIGDPKTGKQYDDVQDISCPECNKEMLKKSDPKQTHIWYEECAECGGVFFDAGEFYDWKYDTFMDRIRDMLKRRRDAAAP